VPGGRTIGFTVSIGVAQWGPEHSRIEEMIRRADGALYAVKRGGRNRVVSADDRDGQT